MPRSMISAIILIAYLDLIGTGALSSPANNLAGMDRNQPRMLIATTTTTTTTESPASGVLDDPMNSATTGDSTDESSWDDICVRCYDKVKLAQDMVQKYDNISRKQKKLINRKKDEAAANAASTSAHRSRSKKINRSTNTSDKNSQNSTVRQRALTDQGGLIVVSRLRVARSSVNDQTTPNQRTPPSKDKYWLNKKDVELEGLKKEQQSQKEITCKSLSEVRDCLEQLTRECIGNLQFHSYEVYSEQLIERLRCPYPNKPALKPFSRLSMRNIDSLEEPSLPVARPITSPEEVRKRLWNMLPDRQFPRPPGVRLIQHQTQSVEQAKGSFHPLTLSHPNSNDDRFVVGRILLVPACFAVLVALLAVLHYKGHWMYEKDASEEQNY